VGILLISVVMVLLELFMPVRVAPRE
jgi:hypothetical protein